MHVKKITPIFLKYDYGIKKRGESTEKLIILPALAKVADEVKPFWLEENGYPDDQVGLQKRVIEFVNFENPEIVFFILMRDEVTADTLAELSKKYITINWFSDDHFRFEKYSQFVAPNLSFVVTVDKYSISKYKKIGYNNVIHSQWAPFEYVKNIDFADIHYLYDISFVGGKNLTREWMIYELEKAGYRVACFGAGWKNGRVSYERMKEIFLRTKINLNLSNSISHDLRIKRYCWINFFNSIIRNPKFVCKNLIQLLKYYKYLRSAKNAEQIKARNFDIPGCGGFELTQYALEIEDYYDIGKEITVFSNIEELKRQVAYYLENESIRESIRLAGYLKTAEYTFENRFQKIFERVFQ